MIHSDCSGRMTRYGFCISNRLIIPYEPVHDARGRGGSHSAFSNLGMAALLISVGGHGVLQLADRSFLDAGNVGP